LQVVGETTNIGAHSDIETAQRFASKHDQDKLSAANPKPPVLPILPRHAQQSDRKSR
jgi:hypothetical protein